MSEDDVSLMDREAYGPEHAERVDRLNEIIRELNRISRSGTPEEKRSAIALWYSGIATIMGP